MIIFRRELDHTVSAGEVSQAANPGGNMRRVMETSNKRDIYQVNIINVLCLIEVQSRMENCGGRDTSM